MRERFLPSAAGAVAAALLLPGAMLRPAAAPPDAGVGVAAAPVGVAAAAAELLRRWNVLLTPPEGPPDLGPLDAAAAATAAAVVAGVFRFFAAVVC
jgi:hypothetical protein